MIKIIFTSNFATYIGGECYELPTEEANYYLGTLAVAKLCNGGVGCGCGDAKVVEPIVSEVIEVKPMVDKKTK